MDAQLRIGIVLATIDKMSAPINAAFSKAQNRLSSFAKKTEQLADKSFKTGQQLIGSGLAVAAPLYKAFDAASEYETKMVDIGKQLQANNPQEYAAKLASMSKQVLSLGHELPLATGEIQEMIASSLRMGVAEDKVVDFTKQVTKMAVAFDMPAGEIADSVGKIANVFKIPIEKVGDFADAINYLDDNTMAKGPELIDVLQRIGGSAKALKANDAAALASTMLSLGESAETSGSGINAMLNKLGAATMQSKKFQEGMEMLGLSSADIQKKMSSQGTAKNAIMDVFDHINKLKPEKQTEALVRLFGAEHGPKLAKLANNMKEFRRQLELVQGAEKGSMDKEYQKRIETSAAKMQIFKNRINELWVTIGNSLLPVVNKIIAKASVWLDKIGKFIEKHPTLVGWIIKAALAFSALSIAGGYLSFVIGGVAKFFSIAIRVGSLLVNVFKYLRLAFLILRLVIIAFPIVGWILGIATAALLIYKYWEPIKAFFIGIWDKIKGFVMPVLEVLKKAFLNFTPIGWIIQLWKPITGFIGSIFRLVMAILGLFFRFGKWLFLNLTPIGWIIKYWKPIVGFFTWLWDKVKDKLIWAAQMVYDYTIGPFVKLGKALFEVGNNIIQSIVDGIKAGLKWLTDVVDSAAQAVRDFFPFSPAKTGPLRDIHKVRLIETVADGVKPAPLVNKVKSAVQLAYNATVQPMGPGLALQGISPNTTGISNSNFNLTINLSGGATKDDAKRIAMEVQKIKLHKARVGFD